jgi:L-malate glycosyltransferase
VNIAIMLDTLGLGGAERQAIVCVAELRKLGHFVDLIYYHPICEYRDLLERVNIEPIYVESSTFGQRCCHLRTLFRSRNYHVVHGFKMAAEAYAAVAGTWARVPYRFGSFRNIYNLSFPFCVLHYMVDKFLDGWIVNSNAGAETLAQHTGISPRKIRVLPNGVYAEMFHTSMPPKEAKARLGLRDDAIIVTMMARLEPAKNHRMLIQVASKVVREVPQVCFLAVGKGSLQNDLVDFAAREGLADKVLFLGHRSDVAEILAATDISVLTSNYEGLPNVIIESMAAGKPILCTNYQGFEQILTHEANALISPCGDVQAFSEQVVRLTRDPCLRNRLANTARRYAQTHFSPETMARNLQAIYLHSAGNRSTGLF